MFKLESAAFAHRTSMPTTYTAKGDNISPPLSWEDIPRGTRSLALIVDDPDVPDPAAPKKTFTHFVLYNIPPEVTVLEENFRAPPRGAKLGLNDHHHARWDGPNPPKGEHRYFYKLYALDTTLNFDDAPTKTQLLAAMQDHVLAQTELIGLYGTRQ